MKLKISKIKDIFSIFSTPKDNSVKEEAGSLTKKRVIRNKDIPSYIGFTDLRREYRKLIVNCAI